MHGHVDAHGHRQAHVHGRVHVPVQVHRDAVTQAVPAQTGDWPPRQPDPPKCCGAPASGCTSARQGRPQHKLGMRTDDPGLAAGIASRCCSAIAHHPPSRSLLRDKRDNCRTITHIREHPHTRSSKTRQVPSIQRHYRQRTSCEAHCAAVLRRAAIEAADAPAPQRPLQATLTFPRKSKRLNILRTADVQHWVIRNPLALCCTSPISSGEHPSNFTKGLRPLLPCWHSWGGVPSSLPPGHTCHVRAYNATNGNLQSD